MNALGADLIPDPPTAGDFCRRFSEADVARLMEAINAVRPQLWAGRGRELLGPITYIDADGSVTLRTDGPRTPTDLREDPWTRNDVQDATKVWPLGRGAVSVSGNDIVE